DRQYRRAGGAVAVVVRRGGAEGVQYRDDVGHRDRHLFLALHCRSAAVLRPAEPARDRQGQRTDPRPRRARLALAPGSGGMELIPLVQPGRQIIERYGPTGFRVSGVIHLGPVLVFADRTMAWADAAMTPEGLAPVVEHG